jgi:glycosyltransferase involved in cell wall biosynthesis
LLERVAILGGRGYPSTYGGYETLVRYLVPDWVQRGLDVTVYCRSRPTETSSWKVDGATCRYTRGIETKSLSTLSYGLSASVDARARPYDAVLVLNIANGFFLPFLRRRGIGTALNTDGIEWQRGKWGTVARRVFRASARASARWADVLVADSTEIARIWQTEFDVESTFIPYGAPVLKEQPVDRVRQLGLEPGSYVLVVARLIPENNIDLTLDALELCDGLPAVIVGDTNYDTDIANRLERLSKSGKVIWLGHVDEPERLEQLWAAAGVYVHGHSVGGTNPALLQALGAGAPTLALDGPFNREVVASDEQLYASDPIQLAKKIRDVIDDQSKRRAWREHGQSVVSERYRWPDICERYLVALQEAQETAIGRTAR